MQEETRNINVIDGTSAERGVECVLELLFKFVLFIGVEVFEGGRAQELSCNVIGFDFGVGLKAVRLLVYDRFFTGIELGDNACLEIFAAARSQYILFLVNEYIRIWKTDSSPCLGIYQL